MIKIGIIGAKNSGKTTLIEKLITQFKAIGFRVATIKHTAHEHDFDTKGKDTWRHRKAGADLTMAVGPKEIGIFGFSEAGYIQALEEIMSNNFDVCLIEGDKHGENPKIFLTRKAEIHAQPVPGSVIATYGPEPGLLNLKHFELHDVLGLVKFLQEKYLVEERKAIRHV